jgi:hypothetical protein
MSPAATRTAALTEASRRSAIPTATATSSRRSPTGSPAGSSRWTSRALAALLLETAEHHDPYEKSSQPHNWWDWYAAYLSARLAGSSQDEASAGAGRYMAETKHVLPL